MKTRVVAIVVINALLLLTISPALPAETPSPVRHVVMPEQLQEAVQDSNQKVNDARNFIQDYLERAEIKAQIQHYGLDATDATSRIAALSEPELLLIQRQIMSEDLQKGMVGGWTRLEKALLIIGAALAVGGTVALVTGSNAEMPSQTRDSNAEMPSQRRDLIGIICLISAGVLLGSLNLAH